MTPSCSLTQAPGGKLIKAGWALEKDMLLLTPDGAPPSAYPIQNLSGISGDGFSLKLTHSEGSLLLERLGADGPTLLETLRRRWPPLRAEALRLTGTGDAGAFSCQVSTGQGFEACGLLAYEEVILVAPDGRDLWPLFLPLVSEVSLDDASLAVTAKNWDGSSTVFGKLANRTMEFYERLLRARAELSRKGRELLGVQLPRLGQGSLAALAGTWPPGRMAPTNELERAIPGFSTAFEDWLARTPRHAEGRALLDSALEAHLGYSLAPPEGGGPPEETPEQTGGGAQELTGPVSTAVDSADAQPLLWLLVRLGEFWLLETLSEGDHATYRFARDVKIPGLASQLLCAPEFSKEALYLPLEALTGERAPLATPAQELGFLRELRARFKGRIIHRGLEQWLKEIGLGA